MKILITNIVLAGRSGTEIFVAQLSRQLRSMGHDVALYSPLCGPIAEEISRRGTLVYDSIDNVAFTPDIIHGHHNGPTMTALAQFPETPAIFVCHSVEAEFDRPPIHPNIQIYYAVSEFVRRRWSCRELRASSVRILSNAAEIDGTAPPRTLPAMPCTAVLVSKYGENIEPIREACRARAIALKEYGFGIGRVSASLGDIFAHADVVFALAFLFRLLLGRVPSQEEWIERLDASLGRSLADVTKDFLDSEEFRRGQKARRRRRLW